MKSKHLLSIALTFCMLLGAALPPALQTAKISAAEPKSNGRIALPAGVRLHLKAEKYLKPLVDNLLLGVINEEAAGMTVRDEDKAFIAQVYSYAFVGLMLDWIRDDMREDPETLVNRLATVIRGGVAQALERFRL